MQTKYILTQETVAQKFKESGLKKLDLSFEKMEILGADYLEKILQENASTITTLELSGSSISDRKIQILANVLPELTALTQLSLDFCGICDQDAIILAETLEKCTSLTRLKVDLRANNIGTQGAQAIIKALPNCPSLIAVNVASNDLDAAEMNQIYSLATQNKAAMLVRREEFVKTMVLLALTKSIWSGLSKDVLGLIVDQMNLQGHTSIGKNKEQIRKYAQCIFGRSKVVIQAREKRELDNNYGGQFSKT